MSGARDTRLSGSAVSWIGWNRETAMILGVVVVLIASGLLVAFVPGVVEDPTAGQDRPGALRIGEVTISASGVTGENVTLELDNRLEHRGGVSENITLEIRATHRESGLLATSKTSEVGQIEGAVERSVVEEIVVPREGGYVVDIIVFRDGERISSTSREIRGVGTLTPAYAQTPVEFHRFDQTGETDLPVIPYSIAESTGNQTTLSVSTYLTNTGDSPVGGHELVFRARQAESNIIAAESTVTIDEVPPGETAQPRVELTVPAGYNYYLDGFLWKNGVLVGDAVAAANLDPTREISVNQTRESVGLEVSDFERAGPPARPERTVEEDVEQPGFGIALAVLAVLIGVLMSYRRRAS